MKDLWHRTLKANETKLKNCRSRLTSWLLQSVTEELNSGVLTTHQGSGKGESLNPGSPEPPKPVSHPF